jgi:hypothetical protein
MSPTPSDELDPTLPGAQPSRAGKPKPVPTGDDPTLGSPVPQESADESEDGATLLKPSQRTVVRGSAIPEDLTRPSAAGRPAVNTGASASSAGTVGGNAGADSTRTASGVAGGAAARREPQILGGRFEVVEVLGEGGMGKVYSVRDRQIEGRVVALKVLLPKFSRNEKFRSLFFQEIRAAQNFVNEHVVQVRDCGQMDDGRLFVTMDLVSGESLRDLLAREASLRPRHALEIAKQVLLALHSGHERGFVHRDVKPSNVMLTTRVPKTDENPYGVGARVLDFGIAGLAAELDEGNVAGTPLYMSPEQIQGQRLDARSDLFAVGVVLYEMLAGRRPFEGKTLQQITTSVIETDLAPQIAEMKELSAPIRKILEKALQKNRDQRFQSATDFIKAIETSSAYKLPSAVPGWAWGALVVCAAAAAGEGWVLRTQAQRLDTLQDERVAMQKRVDEAQDEITRKLNEAQGARTGELNEKANQLAARDQQLSEANAALFAAQERLATLETELAKSGAKDDDQMVELRTQLESLRRDFEQEKTAREAASRDKQLVDEELLRMRKEQDRLSAALQESERERTALTAQLNPSARKAHAFDDVLSILEKRGGAQARSLYDQAVGERVFERSSRPGTDLVEELIEAELAIERFDTSRAQGGALDIPSLLDASRRLTQAKNLRQNFQVAANDWLAFETPDGSPEQRVERLDGYVRALSERITPEVGAISAYHTQDWERIAAQGAVQGPATALEHQKLFGCEHALELARTTLAHCDATLAPGGKLDVRALGGAAHLDEWGAHLEATRDARDEASSALLAYVYARRWYDSDEANDQGFDWTRVPTPKVEGPVRDWRAVLRLQYELAQPGSGYPNKAGRRLVFRMQNESPLRWRVLEAVRGAESGASGPWELAQSNFKADALPIGAPETMRIVRRRGVFLVDGASDPLLDLKAAGDNVWVAPFPKLFDQLPPPQLGVSQVVMKEHLERIAAGMGPCLVFKRGAVVRWFSPEFGMVLEELEGQPIRTELVFATPLR